jgi:hypothetical protein
LRAVEHDHDLQRRWGAKRVAVLARDQRDAFARDHAQAKERLAGAGVMASKLPDADSGSMWCSVADE